MNLMAREKIEKEIIHLCEEALIFVPQFLEFARSAEGKVFYLKMMGDFTRYIADASIKDNYRTKVLLA